MTCCFEVISEQPPFPELLLIIDYAHTPPNVKYILGTVVCVLQSWL